jgi:Leucine-rich repeat (LRR) protein
MENPNFISKHVFNNYDIGLKFFDDNYLDLSSNNLTDLSAFDFTKYNNMRTLDVRDNKLTELPPLHKGLMNLFCHINLLTELPPLPPSLVKLACSNNPIVRLPQLPDGLKNLEIVQTPVRVFENIPPNLEKIWLSPWHMQGYLEKFSNTQTIIFIRNNN